MADTTIPVTYPGHPDYSLAFRMDHGTLFVRRSWPASAWKPVIGCVGAPSARDSNDVAVTINGDLRVGMPFYVHMDAISFERVQTLIRQAEPVPHGGR